MNQLTQFNGTPVSIIDHNGKKWLTAEEIGLCLGYAKGNAREGILRLYNRNTDEFTEADSTAVNLTAVDGKLREMRVFSETGCNKLGFFSNTPKSKEFRHWAAQVLVGQVPAPVAVVVPKKKNGRTSITRAIERQVFELFVEGYSQKQIAQTVDISATSVNQLLQAKYRFTPDAGEPECDYALLADVAARQFDIEMERIESMRVRIAQKFMPNANNKELEEVLEQIGQNLNCELLTGSEV